MGFYLFHSHKEECMIWDWYLYLYLLQCLVSRKGHFYYLVNCFLLDHNVEFNSVMWWDQEPKWFPWMPSKVKTLKSALFYHSHFLWITNKAQRVGGGEWAQLHLNILQWIWIFWNFLFEFRAGIREGVWAWSHDVVRSICLSDPSSHSNSLKFGQKNIHK